jgi:uncharacterized protein involved in type VI secretion and phage assembly
MNSHALANQNCLQLGRVVDNVDPESRGRVKVHFSAIPMETWAEVIAPSAGQGYGASFIPRVDEVVVLAFVDTDRVLVLGSVWEGQNSVPTECDPQEDHYAIHTPNGTVIELDDGDGPKLELRTRSGYRVTVTEGDGGAITIERGEQSVALTPSEISIKSSGTVKIEGADVDVSAAKVDVKAGMSKFSGTIQANTVIADAVVGTSYTPGAGNIW